MEFRAETYQNEYLPEGGTSVDAVVTITGTGTDSPGPTGTRVPAAAVVIVIDLSGSMHYERKIVAAQKAAITAIDVAARRGAFRCRRRHPRGSLPVPVARAGARRQGDAPRRRPCSVGVLGRWRDGDRALADGSPQQARRAAGRDPQRHPAHRRP